MRRVLLAALAALAGALPTVYHRRPSAALEKRLEEQDATLERALAKIETLKAEVDGERSTYEEAREVFGRETVTILEKLLGVNGASPKCQGKTCSEVTQWLEDAKAYIDRFKSTTLRKFDYEGRPPSTVYRGRRYLGYSDKQIERIRAGWPRSIGAERAKFWLDAAIESGFGGYLRASKVRKAISEVARLVRWNVEVMDGWKDQRPDLVDKLRNHAYAKSKWDDDELDDRSAKAHIEPSSGKEKTGFGVWGDPRLA
jgi:hypothetical protein